ncbi:Replication-associated recombination protein A [Candidatus Bealeia paramacronuclearis]|uniref:Replication-associated recombination protein A n=1 Tax=Candidatus Bealeia paramacronuclearis TaxID=1921001 RepID=A0ABZ2C552_9PROT|nr:Replication-associated recombination protein A [Candidatus Bealeia paramacronuclearis]
MTSLFSQNTVYEPLASQLRPKSLKEIVGQDHLLQEKGPLGVMLKSGKMSSLILWGPPGCGKTTLARLLADNSHLVFESISAIESGVADLKKVFERAQEHKKMGQGTLLFVDEIHRFNRTQQDSFLPFVENGTVILIGATTENPSFELNSALLSRTQVLVLRRLQDEHLEKMYSRAEGFFGKKFPLDVGGKDLLFAMADGDGRSLYNMIEVLAEFPSEHSLTNEELTQLVSRRAPLYDKNKEGHYNLISALHKALRGSDPDAALYWFARMLEGGEDPLYIARRLIRFASEDVGLADPQALLQTMAATEAYERLGSPEGELAIAQALIYLATAPKSNAVYKAYNQVRKSAQETGSLMPPKHILNAPTKLMRQEGYGDGYRYDHDTAEGFSGQSYFPEDMQRRQFYAPAERGFEREILKRLEYWKKLRDKA